MLSATVRNQLCFLCGKYDSRHGHKVFCSYSCIIFSNSVSKGKDAFPLFLIFCSLKAVDKAKLRFSSNIANLNISLHILRHCQIYFRCPHIHHKWTLHMSQTRNQMSIYWKLHHNLQQPLSVNCMEYLRNKIMLTYFLNKEGPSSKGYFTITFVILNLGKDLGNFWIKPELVSRLQMSCAIYPNYTKRKLTWWKTIGITMTNGTSIFIVGETVFTFQMTG